MKLTTLKDGTPAVIVNNQGIPLADLGFEGTLMELIQSGEAELDNLRQALNNHTGSGREVTTGDFAAPVDNPPKIVAIGVNYADHATESEMDLPDTPLVFTKFNSSIISATDAVEIPTELTQEVDYE